MCGGKKKSPPPPPVTAPITDMSTSTASQANADAAAQRAMAGTIISQTEPQQASSFGAELGTATPVTTR
jgi:hypothetical protein